MIQVKFIIKKPRIKFLLQFSSGCNNFHCNPYPQTTAANHFHKIVILTKEGSHLRLSITTTIPKFSCDLKLVVRFPVVIHNRKPYSQTLLTNLILKLVILTKEGSYLRLSITTIIPKFSCDLKLVVRLPVVIHNRKPYSQTLLTNLILKLVILTKEGSHQRFNINS